jgi:regulator of replication initiation timing
MDEQLDTMTQVNNREMGWSSGVVSHEKDFGTLPEFYGFLSVIHNRHKHVLEKNTALEQENENLKERVGSLDIHINTLMAENEALKSKKEKTPSVIQQWKIENDWKTDAEIEAMKTKAVATGNSTALMEAVKEEMRITVLNKTMPKTEKVVGGCATTLKTVNTQKAKHMAFFDKEGGQWMVDNVKCHYCSKCFGTKTKRDQHHGEKHDGKKTDPKWTTAGDAEWVKTFTRS